MKNTFLIGDMAKIHNISPQTLRYYDKIGLLKPKVIDENNGYRYYTIDQFEKLDTIKYLKFLGMPLNEIKEQFKNGEIKNTLASLEKQKILTHEKINELQLILNKIQNKIDCINHCINIEQHEIIQIKDISERTLFSMTTNASSSNFEIELGFRKLQNLFNENHLIFTEELGITISIDNLRKNTFDKSQSIFILIDDKFQCENTIKLSKGKYACIYHKGPYKETYKSYKELLDYISKNNYEIIGDSIEIGLIDSFITLNENDYFTEIQIPIK